jgi:hypothetical protein
MPILPQRLSLHGRRVGLTDSDDLIIPRRRMVATATITTAQLLALNATAISVIPAPGAGLAIAPDLIVIRHAGGTAYADIAAGDDLAFKYTDKNGAQCATVIEATGFLDQTGAQVRAARGLGGTGVTPASWVPAANAAVVLHMLTGEITTGNFGLNIWIAYDIIPTTW